MKISFLLGLLLSVAILSSCGDDGKSSKIKITIIPDSPIVFTGDVTLPIPNSTETETISGPWFRFRYKVDNETEGDTVVIMGIQVEIIDSEGNEGSPTSFAPEELPGTRTIFIELASGGSFTESVNLYVHSLNETGSFRYKAAIRFDGWFGTENDQQERFRKTVNIITQ